MATCFQPQNAAAFSMAISHLNHNEAGCLNVTESIRPQREHRVRAFKAGIISFQDGSLTANCTVKNITSKGARLQLETAELVPNAFRLSIPVDGKFADCEVRWRNGNLMGVAFDGPMETDSRHQRIQSVNPLLLAGAPSAPTLRKKN